jgi:glycerophosphoryl diester phosphodiesterase
VLDRAAFLRPIAHRGLHNAKRGIVENTGPAFEAAMEKGYGIECDVRPAADGLPIVFHDATLMRLVKGRGTVAKLTERQLKLLRHRVGGAPILTIGELLDLVSGRVPLLIEIKSEWQPPQKSFLSKIAAAASRYKGPIALMSFDPVVMSEIRSLAPEVPRGIVSGSFKGAGWWARRINPKRAASLRNLLESGPVAPDFYAYDVEALPTPVTEYARQVQGLPLFTWTVRSAKQRKAAANWADAMIFEGFEP